MILLVSLLPSLFLFGGALVFILLFPVPSRIRNLVPLIANLFATVSLFQLARGSSQSITLFPPSDVLPALSITLQWYGAVLPLGIVMLLATSARFFMGMDADPPAFRVGGLVVEAAALLFFAADNWTTVTTAWILVEIGLLIVPIDNVQDPERAARALGWNLAAIVAWLTAGMILTNEGGSLRLEEATLQGTAALLVFLAIWIRSGLYPFHAAAPASVSSIGIRLGIPLLLGSYLMTRWLAQTHALMDYQNIVQLVVVLVVGISALVTIGEPHSSDSFIWVVRAAGAPLLLLPFWLNDSVSAAISIWLGIGLFTTCVLISIAGLWRARLPQIPLTTILWIGVLLAIAGLPVSTMFWARQGLIGSAYESGRIALWLLLVGTMALLLVPLWREIFASRESAPKTLTRSEVAALVCILIPTIGETIMPTIFLVPFGSTVLFASASAPLLHPNGIASLIFLLAGLGVPLLASFELARRWDRQASLLPLPVTNVLDLSGLARGLDWLYILTRGLVQQTLSLLEQPPIAWLIFLAIWMAAWLRGLGQ